MRKKKKVKATISPFRFRLARAAATPLAHLFITEAFLPHEYRIVLYFYINIFFFQINRRFVVSSALFVRSSIDCTLNAESYPITREDPTSIVFLKLIERPCTR